MTSGPNSFRWATDLRTITANRIQAWRSLLRHCHPNAPLPRRLEVRCLLEGLAIGGGTAYRDVAGPATTTLFVIPTRPARYILQRALLAILSSGITLTVAVLAAMATTEAGAALRAAAALTGLVAILIGALATARAIHPLLLLSRIRAFRHPITHYSFGLGRAADARRGAGAHLLDWLHCWIDDQPGSRIGGHVIDHCNNWTRLQDWYLTHGRVLDEPTNPTARRTIYPPPTSTP